MPSDAAIRTARAIIVAELDSIDDRFGRNITDVEMAEIIDREMGAIPLPWPRDNPCESPLGHYVTGWCGNCGWKSCCCGRNRRFGEPPVPLKS